MLIFSIFSLVLSLMGAEYFRRRRKRISFHWVYVQAYLCLLLAIHILSAYQIHQDQSLQKKQLKSDRACSAKQKIVSKKRR